MFNDIHSIGLAPILSGCAVLLIGCVAGWGIARESAAWPIRMVSRWIDFLVARLLRSRSWLFRAAVILANNATACAVMILLGGVPGGGWAIVTGVGLFMGVALHRLSQFRPSFELAEQTPSSGGSTALIGVLLNLVEIPAIIITLGLCMGQNASPNGVPIERVWSTYLTWVAPCLVIAACGESLWMGRIIPGPESR